MPTLSLASGSQLSFMHLPSTIVEYHYADGRNDSRNEYAGEFRKGVFHGKGTLRLLIDKSDEQVKPEGKGEGEKKHNFRRRVHLRANGSMAAFMDLES